MTIATTDQTPADAIDAADTTFVPQFDADLFGPPQLLAGEDPDQYMALFRSIATTVQPVDIFERQSVRHITDLMWETRRYRRLITQLIDGNDQLGLEKVLRSLAPTAPVDQLWSGTTNAQDLARGYTLKQETAVAEVDNLLASAGLSWDTIKAEAAALRTSEVERFNRLAITAAARVNSSLRELERRRAELAKRLRRAVQRVEAADLQAGNGGQAGAVQIEASQPRVVQQTADVEQMNPNTVADSQADAADDRKLAA